MYEFLGFKEQFNEIATLIQHNNEEAKKREFAVTNTCQHLLASCNAVYFDLIDKIKLLQVKLDRVQDSVANKKELTTYLSSVVDLNTELQQELQHQNETIGVEVLSLRHDVEMLTSQIFSRNHRTRNGFQFRMRLSELMRTFVAWRHQAVRRKWKIRSQRWRNYRVRLLLIRILNGWHYRCQTMWRKRLEMERKRLEQETTKLTVLLDKKSQNFAATPSSPLVVYSSPSVQSSPALTIQQQVSLFTDKSAPNVHTVGLEIAKDENSGLVHVCAISKKQSEISGIQVGDIIVSINSKDIRKLDIPKANALMRGFKNEDVTLCVWRPNGEISEITLHMTELWPYEFVSTDCPCYPKEKGETTAATTATSPNDAQPKAKAYPFGMALVKAGGFVIVELSSDLNSIARSAGVKNGDVVLSINGKSVENPEIATQALSISQDAETTTKLEVIHPTGDMDAITLSAIIKKKK